MVREEHRGQNSEESPKPECPCRGARVGKGRSGEAWVAGIRRGGQEQPEPVRRPRSGQRFRVDVAQWTALPSGCGRWAHRWCGAVGSRLVWAGEH